MIVQEQVLSPVDVCGLLSLWWWFGVLCKCCTKHCGYYWVGGGGRCVVHMVGVPNSQLAINHHYCRKEASGSISSIFFFFFLLSQSIYRGF